MKADENGMFYGFFSPRGFANEGQMYKWPASDSAVANRIDDRARNINGGRLTFLPAFDAIRIGGASIRPLSEHPWYSEDELDFEGLDS